MNAGMTIRETIYSSTLNWLYEIGIGIVEREKIKILNNIALSYYGIVGT